MNSPIVVLRGHIDSVSCIKFIRSNILASGAGDGELKFWDLNTKRCIISLKAHSKYILSLNSLKGDQLVTSGRDGKIYVWDVETFSNQASPLAYFSSDCEHFCNSTTIKDSPGSSIIFSATSQNDDILVFDTRESHKPSYSIKGINQRGMITSLYAKYYENSHKEEFEGLGSEFIFAGHEDGSLSLFDLKTRKLISNEQIHESCPIFSIEVSPSGKSVFTGGASSKIVKSVFSLDKKKEDVAPSLISKRSSLIPSEGTSCIRCRNDERLIASSHWDNSIRLFDLKFKKSLGVLWYHRESVFCIDFVDSNIYESSQNTKFHYFATGSKDKTIAVWDLLGSSYKT